MTSEPVRDNEPIKVLKIDLCSVIAEDEPREAMNVSLRPLRSNVVIENEPARDR